MVLKGIHTFEGPFFLNSFGFVNFCWIKERTIHMNFSKIRFAVVAALMLILMSIPAFAGTNVQADSFGSWAADQNGWWWRNRDGSWPANTWAWLDGNHDGVSESYYFGPDGYMLAGTVTPDGYTVNGNGAWTLNGAVQTRMSTVTAVTNVIRISSNDDDTEDDVEDADYDDDEDSEEDDSESKVNIKNTISNVRQRETGTEVTGSYEDQVIQYVNEERKKQGRRPLCKDPTLMEIAKIRAEEISEIFLHTHPNGQDCFSLFDDYGVGSGYCGENLAKGQTSPSQVMNNWMHSSGHRANILNASYDSIGVGVYQSGGTYYWVQAFTG